MSNFKKALRTIVLFFLIVTVLSMGIMEAFFAGENFYYQDKHERAEYSGTLDFLICGSSYTYRGMKPVILDEELGVESYNISIQNCDMQICYEMIRLEMEQNPVNTVILGVSYNLMAKDPESEDSEGDYYVLSKLDFFDRVSFLLSAVHPSKYIDLYYQCLNKGFECMDMMVHGTWVGRNENVDKGYVQYENPHNVKWDDEYLVPNYMTVYNTESVSEEVYEENIKSLDKILELCEENHVNLIMITVPLSKTALSRYRNLDVSREWYEEYAQNNGISYYDFNLYKGYDDLFTDMVDYHDAYHLNNTGADKFSKLFCAFYKKIESDEDVSNLFYDSYDKMKSIAFK